MNRRKLRITVLMGLAMMLCPATLLSASRVASMPNVSYYCIGMHSELTYTDTVNKTQKLLSKALGYLSRGTDGLVASANREGVDVYRSGVLVNSVKEKDWGLNILGWMPGRLVLDRKGTRSAFDLLTGKEAPVALRFGVLEVMPVGKNLLIVSALSQGREGTIVALRNTDWKQLRTWESSAYNTQLPGEMIGGRYAVCFMKRYSGATYLWVIDTVGTHSATVKVGGSAPDFCEGRSANELVFCRRSKRQAQGSSLYTDVLAVNLVSMHQGVLLRARGEITPIGLSRDHAWFIGLRPYADLYEGNELIGIRLSDGKTTVLKEHIARCMLND
jgi:hypothetical protein